VNDDSVIARARTNVTYTLLAWGLLLILAPLAIAVDWLIDVLEIEGEASDEHRV